MLRSIALIKSQQLLACDGFLIEHLPALLMRGQGMQLTSLSSFSSTPLHRDAEKPTSSVAGGASTDGVKASSSSSKTSPSPPASQDTGIDPETLDPAQRRIHENSNLFRKWLEGKIDEKLQEPETSPRRQPYPPRNQNRQQPSYQSQRQQYRPQQHNPSSVTSAGSSSGGQYPSPGGQQQQQQQRQQPKYRTKDPAKDWKHAARTARTAEERITNIIVPESDPNSQGQGRYGWLGGASDAPKINQAITNRAEEVSPMRINPHRLFYPGQTYSPDELDPYKSNSFMDQTGRLFAARTTVPASTVEQFADFRNAAFLSQFVTATGKLVPRRRTRLSAKLHSAMTREIKLARTMALLHPTQRVFQKPKPGRRPEMMLGMPKQLLEQQQLNWDTKQESMYAERKQRFDQRQQGFNRPQQQQQRDAPEQK